MEVVLLAHQRVTAESSHAFVVQQVEHVLYDLGVVAIVLVVTDDSWPDLLKFLFLVLIENTQRADHYQN